MPADVKQQPVDEFEYAKKDGENWKEYQEQWGAEQTPTLLKKGMTKSELLKMVEVQAREVDSDGIFWLYYSGHGCKGTGDWATYVNQDWLKTHTTLE